MLSIQLNIASNSCLAAINELQHHSLDKLKNIENYKNTGEIFFYATYFNYFIFGTRCRNSYLKFLNFENNSKNMKYPKDFETVSVFVINFFKENE